MVGKKLRTLREYRNFSQEYMAEQLGLSQGAYSKYETNQSKMNVEVLKKVAQILDVSPMDLLNNQSAVVNPEPAIHGHEIPHIDNFFSFQREFVEKMVASKDEQIAALQKTIASLEVVIQSLIKR